MSGTGMGGHQSSVSSSDDWITPKYIIEALGPFDLDPCASTLQPWETALRSLTLKDDGLQSPWRGRVWLNPPYGRETGKWLLRLREHFYGTALIFARTETKMFFETVWEGASAVMFLRGRVRFFKPSGESGRWTGGAPSVLVAYGKYDSNRLCISTLDGKFIRL